MNTPLVTIIIPVYNSESYIQKCIDNVLSQTYKYLQIILVNDGSTDNSLDLCEKVNDNADSIMVRVDAYKDLIISMFSHPIIGGLLLSDGRGGGHSAIMDTFAKYGVFGGYVFVRMVFGNVLDIKKSPKTERIIRVANATFIAMLLVLLFNSMPFNLVCTIMFIVPICYNEILKWRKNDESTMDGKPAPKKRGKTHWHKV